MKMNRDFFTFHSLVTPIHKNPKSKSNMNYREQVKREKDGIQFKWDATG